MTTIPPISLSLIACDEVTRDRGSGKISIHGILHDFVASRFPAVHPRFTVWVELTNGHGETPMLIRINRVTAEDLDGEPILEAGFTAHFDEPSTVVHFRLAIQNLELPRVGEYQLKVECAGALVASRRLLAITPFEDEER